MGLGGVPEVPHPAGRGQSTSIEDLGAAVNTASRSGEVRIEQLCGYEDGSERAMTPKTFEPSGVVITRAAR